MTPRFNYCSLRAKEARAAKVLGSKLLNFFLTIMMILSFATGCAILFWQKHSYGWLFIAPLPILIMFKYWVKHALIDMPKGRGESLNDILAGEVLALLPKNPSPQNIAKILPKMPSAQFFFVRFGFSPKMLETITAMLNADSTPVFANAMEIRKQTNSEQLTGEILAIALLMTVPNYQDLLSSMKLSIKDLFWGINWYNYLNGLVKDAQKPRRTGGIARDFAFGYTPLLDRYGTNLSAQREHAGKTRILQSARHETLLQMTQILSQRGRRNVALIGNYGSGRSTLTDAFAELLLDADSKVPSNLKFCQLYSLDASTLISAAGPNGQLENLVIRILNEAYAAKNIIICLDNAQLFFKQNGSGSVDISNVLQPILESGHLRMILEMDQQDYLEIAARNNAIASVLNRIMINPTDQDETLKVLMDQVPILEYKSGVTYTYQALVESYHLSERYIHDVEMPGKAKILLDAAANFAENGIVTRDSVIRAIEKTQGVKVQSATTTSDKNRLLNLESLIHERMVDQSEAVTAVASALRRAAAGVRNQSRPIGTFLFLGPTGVGKTELAKALSQVYFDGEKEIVRLDLNEYVLESDVNRLIADAASDPMSLTAQVMKKPFSVVLLDEIEKAHPLVLTTLLQLLDEGILRDSKNHEVSFRDCIVIATSNAGAKEIHEHIQKGQHIADFREDFTNHLIASNQFKPEFLNRFDEICIFKPLAQSDLYQILDLNIAAVNKTLAPQKISITLDAGARDIMVVKGYDPSLGARPMRRLVQKTVENFVAHALLSGKAKSGDHITISADDILQELS